MPITGSGWEIHIKRVRQERCPGMAFDRTVSTYKVFHNGTAVPGLSGSIAERQGPGDNTQVGKAAHARIAAKTYDLSTHDGSSNERFKTIGYTQSTAIGAESMPSIRLLDTGARAGVLIHPAAGFVWSIGCLNPSAPLSGATSTIGWLDSRRRVIALIEDMKAFLDGDFPASNNVRIPRARAVIEGEPG